MLIFVFSALVALLDQLFKHWVVRAIPLRETMDLIPGVIGLTQLHNYGAAFGIFSGMRWELVGVKVLCIFILIFILLRYNEGFFATLGLGAVLGGAVGNLIDRVFHGYVVDMFELQFINFAVFNIADIFITVGGITFVIFYIISSVKSAKKKDEESSYAYEYAEENEEILDDAAGEYIEHDDAPYHAAASSPAHTAAESATDMPPTFDTQVKEHVDTVKPRVSPKKYEPDYEEEPQLPAFGDLQDIKYTPKKESSDSSSTVFSTDALAYDSDTPILTDFDRPSVLEELDLSSLDFDNAESLGDVDMDALLREYSSDGNDDDNKN